MNFDHTQIKNINLKFSSFWNPETHNIVLSYDPTVKTGFTVKIQPIDLSDATTVLNKFRIKK